MADKNKKTVKFPTAAGAPEAVATRTVPQDLIINALKCIDAAAKRGAYHGGELSSVGHVRDGLYDTVSDVIEEIIAAEQAAMAPGNDAAPTAEQADTPTT